MATATSPLNGVDFLTIPVEDLDRARRFYGEVLGLEPSILYQPEGRPPLGAEFEAGNLTLALLHMASVEQPFHPTRAPLEFHVDDFEAAKAELEARGVTFAGEAIDSGVCLQALFYDSEGNLLAIHHRYVPR